MSDTAALLARLADDAQQDQQRALRRLREWAHAQAPAFRRAGRLRGLAALGTVGWAAGLGLAAKLALHGQRSGVTPVSVLPAVCLVAAGLALRAWLLTAGDRAADEAAAAVRHALRGRLLDAALPAWRQPASTTESQPGDAAYVQALDEEVDRLTDWLTGYVPARRTMLIASGIVLAAIASGSWLVALLLVLATPLLPANLKVIGMGTRTAVQAQLTAARTLSARLLDQLRGLPTLVGLGADERAALAVEQDDRELAHRTQAVLRVAFLSTAWVELLITGTLAVVATYCGLVLLDYLHLPGIPSTMGLGTALFALVLTPAYFAPVRELARGYHARAEASAAAELVHGLLDVTATGRATPRPADAPRSIHLSGVGVAFPQRDRPALDDVTLTAHPGRVLALTGPSGAGKSTLLAVAAGLLAPDSGSSTHQADGTRQPADPRAVSWIGQPCHLLPGTVRANLLLARPDADDAALDAAFATLGFADLRAALPDGLDTVVGERGSGLSSGQIQQLVFVRALLRDAPVLCLDEPTAHLDPDAEERVMAAVRTLARDRTVLLATHSPALLRIADTVVAVDRGRISTVTPYGVTS
ncbi:ATP-binding cassette domain-containing protein [Kitasatospora sp. MAP5-34]|uniref:ATP-binding cassette domain-containing protein n=1 Tax=Kitasatospora sp. MAP5-34 TaxID=3035102 RepID=UPI0024736472|nr:ATP-binding cassette domain-containing protein [Kitasatospora sp. MAP5-34]MDH6578213.1 ATP-binding cassette subfamily C protein CydD [Kitasatospora sp. MAP5-34]